MQFAKLKKILISNPDVDPWVWAFILSPGQLSLWANQGDELFFRFEDERALRNRVRAVQLNYVVFRDITKLLDEPLPDSTERLRSLPILVDFCDAKHGYPEPVTVTQETFHLVSRYLNAAERRIEPWNALSLSRIPHEMVTFRDRLKSWNSHLEAERSSFIVKRTRTWNTYAESFMGMALDIYRIPKEL